jgi:hypothetical protein
VRLVAAFLAALFVAAEAHAQLSTRVHASGFSSPIAFVQDPVFANVQYVVEQAGRIRVVRDGAVLGTDFLDIRSSVASGGERGLLGLVFDPNYASNRRFYVNFTNLQGHTVVARFRRSAGDPLVADPVSRFDFRWNGSGQPALIEQPFSNHNGGHLAFGPDGYLYIGLGDGGSANDPGHRAQTPGTLLGKMLRVDVNVDDAHPIGYGIPPTNPFLASGPAGTRPEIWSFGLRNPWRYAFDDPARGGNGGLFIADVGQGAREEVNTPIVNGGNYGWRIYEGTACTNTDRALCTPANYLFPTFDYPHTGGRCSITGGYVYRGTIGSLPTGTYVYGDYCTGEIFTWSDGEQRLLLDTTFDISSFGEDDAGEIYVADLNGRVSRIAAGGGGGAECQYDVAPVALVRRAGETLTVSVSTTAGCSWTALSGSEWVSVAGDTHSGSGVVSVMVASHPGWLIPRFGFLTVAGKSVVILQF